MKPITKTFVCVAFIGFPPVTRAAAQIEVTAANKLPLARHSETIEIPAKDLSPLAAKSLNLVHVKDSSGKELICQAIDNDSDELREFDAVIFQADFAANETKPFTLTVGEKQVYSKDQYKAFGRFVRERFDDFAWENDLIAHRTYGKALETWKGEPLTSSTIDIWSKRTPKMIINDWYLADDYHVDHGEGADYYSAGKSRGCGGSGLWENDRLWVSKNFVGSNVLANGPIRVLFELKYEAFNVGALAISETKRISLDAGSQFDRFENHYGSLNSDEFPLLTAAIGLKKAAGEKLEMDAAQGWIVKWEKMEKNAGSQGLAILTRPGNFSAHAEDELNHFVITKLDAGRVLTYWAGFAWDKAGRFTDAEAWKKHVIQFAQALSSPIQVTMKPGA